MNLCSQKIIKKMYGIMHSTCECNEGLTGLNRNAHLGLGVWNQVVREIEVKGMRAMGKDETEPPGEMCPGY